MSRELILNMSISTDGFVAGANGELDWVFRNSTEESREWAVAQLADVSLHVMGRQSYQAMADYWPTADGPFAPAMNNVPKAVFSRSGQVTAPDIANTKKAVQEARVDGSVLDSWASPLALGRELVKDVESLKSEDGGPINALGGASFASSLIAANLVDMFRLVVHPVVLGQGLAIFAGLTSPLDFDLVDLKTFDSGILVKTLRPRNTR